MAVAGVGVGGAMAIDGTLATGAGPLFMVPSGSPCVISMSTRGEPTCHRHVVSKLLAQGSPSSSEQDHRQVEVRGHDCHDDHYHQYQQQHQQNMGH
jgi:hypothetical protein